MSSFAKNQLLKFGWTEGKGLGKNENGIVEAIKPILKFDTAGIGHDQSEYNWWEHVYNKASSNIEVKKSNSSEIKLEVKDTDAVEIATSLSELTLKKVKKDRSLHLGSFIKTSTLHDGKSVEDEEKPSFNISETIDKVHTLTDEEIFAACGGRTAHKGARHGLKLNGKLARIQRQEWAMLNLELGEPGPEWQDIVGKKEKKKKKKQQDSMDFESNKCDQVQDEVPHSNPTPSAKDTDNHIIPNGLNDDNDDDLVDEVLDGQERKRKKSRKSARKEKRKFEELADKMTSLVVSDDQTKNESRKTHKDEPERKRRKRMANDQANNNNNEAGPPAEDFAQAVQDPGCTDDGFVSGDGDQPMNTTSYLAEIAKKLNRRIKKKKKTSHERKERKKLEKLTKGLETLQLASPSDLVVDVSEKRKKKKKRSKADKLIYE